MCVLYIREQAVASSTWGIYRFSHIYIYYFFLTMQGQGRQTKKCVKSNISPLLPPLLIRDVCVLQLFIKKHYIYIHI